MHCFVSSYYLEKDVAVAVVGEQAAKVVLIEQVTSTWAFEYIADKGL